MPRDKASIITFKADDSLVQALRGVPNRSSFIRSAILAALENTCPLCLGTGILNPEQRTHWDAFSANHSVEECRDCHEWYLVCDHEPRRTKHRPARMARAR